MEIKKKKGRKKLAGLANRALIRSLSRLRFNRGVVQSNQPTPPPSGAETNDLQVEHDLTFKWLQQDRPRLFFPLHAPSPFPSPARARKKTNLPLTREYKC